jgi:hypothetical protein
MTAGRIVTFYSYKGGAGRSMALANVAWILATNGRRVLAIDWDLEAPGLHRFFYPFLRDPQLTASSGVIDYFFEFAADAVSSTPATGKRTLLHHASSLEWGFPKGGTIDFIGAGRLDSTYGVRVNGFPWQTFYERLGGLELIERMKHELSAEYDYVLVDSRTGVSDTAGICTVALPDALVVCFTLNAQSLQGTAGVARAALAQRRDRPLELFPVAMRVEYGEKALLERAREFARAAFAPLVSNSLQPEYWSDVQFPYVPFYAYEEILAPLTDAPYSTASVLTAAESLTRYVTHGAVSSAMPLSEEERQRLRAAYASGASAFDTSPDDAR